MNAPPRAFSYVRFSTPEQMKGDSLRRQLDLSARYARDHGLVLDEELTYRDLGVSAFDKSNLGVDGELRKFLEAVEHGHVPTGSVLLVESLDRLSRAKVMDAQQVFLSILRRGITIVTLADGMTYSGDAADQNQVFLSLVMSLLIMSRAHEESLTKSRRLKEAWSQKRRNIENRKLTSICPAWLRLSRDGTTYEFVPEGVAIVRQIITLMRSGLGRGAIVRRLNAEGVHSIAVRQKNRTKNGRDLPPGGDRHTWFESYIQKIITSRALIGEFQPHCLQDGRRVPAGEPIPDYFPRVLSDDEFALLQALISARGRRSGGNRGTGFSNLFTGLARCGYCGSSMVHVDKGIDKRGPRPSRANRFLVCGAAKRGAGCHHVPWNYLDFEDAFFAYAKHTDFANFVRMTNDSASSLRSVNDQLVIERAKRMEIVTRQSRLVEAIATAAVPPEAVLDKIAELEAQGKGCDARLAALEAEVRSLTGRQELSDVALEALQEVADALHSKQGEELFFYRTKLNEYLRRVIERIALFPGGTIHSSAEVERIKGELLQNAKYPPEEVEKYAAAALRTTPDRHERYFVIKNRHQKIRVLQPDSPVPDIFEVLERNPGFWLETTRLTREQAEAAVTG